MHGPPDTIGDSLVAPAVALAGDWIHAGDAALTWLERRRRSRFRRLTSDARSLVFTMGFCDRVLRPEEPAVAAAALREIAAGPPPAFLSAGDRLLLRAGVRASSAVPGLVMPLTRMRLRQLVGGLVVDRADPALARHLRRLRAAGFAVNVNLLGEYVLGDAEAARRLQGILDLIAREDVDYVSVKASAVASQLNLWGYEQSLARVMQPLRTLYRAAVPAPGGATFVNLDMEDYRDLRLTVDAFTRLLDEPGLRAMDAGIVLQAYLPDSFDVLRELVGWAGRRRARGGGTVKVRIVKGANLAMEAVDAAMHGWPTAPYPSKAETDANYARMLDWVLDVERLAAVRVGVASHNLFDVAWSHLLAQSRGVTDRVDIEMLQGMAPGIDRAVQAAAGRVRLYTPVVAAADLDTALAYLFRRLEENSGSENFLHSMFNMHADACAFGTEQARFEAAVTGRWAVASGSRRHRAPPPADRAGFRNVPDADPTDERARERVLQAVAGYRPVDLPAEITDTATMDRAVRRAREAAAGWAAQPPERRRTVLRAVAAELAARRPQLLAVMAHEGRKTLSEGDPEVSETIDMAAYYAEHVPGATGGQASPEPEADFEPLGIVVVAPPWNFPLAIPGGGVFAALAAGNAVLFKPAPQTPRCGYAIAQVVWDVLRAAGLPTEVLQYVRCPEQGIGEHVIGHADIDGIVLTGARATAGLFARLAPRTPLFAETSGKNALVVMPDADLDLAAADLARSAFGHAGQKCSAASLGILVGGAYASPRFRRQLVDAVRSMVLGPADDPATALPPLIGPARGSLERAFTTLDPGERWLLEPRLVDAARDLWSPGIKLGVRPGSWFHRTECFGPVLGLVPAADLDEALAIQNGTAYGLTGGIHTLDPVIAGQWCERVEVGNAYVNRVTTGAVVQRQPFGGWKGSVAGPGAKAGGPNYVAQLGHWRDRAGEAGLPARGREPDPAIAEWLRPASTALDPRQQRWLQAALRSDAWWQRHHFGIGHDPAGLFCEANVFRYRPLPTLIVRVEQGADPAHLLRALAAARAAGCNPILSLAPTGTEPPMEGISSRRETAVDFADRIEAHPPARVRLLGPRPDRLPRTVGDCFIDGRPVVADGRIEGLRYRREQSVSRTLHRFGNLIATSSGAA